ncbi:MAG TPA: winged helix-turn-helix domain-containing protein [Planctomycetota bacterium]|nr:winged helix-turn-helix domain-containing protein [Planctomycetota bacterium]
MLSLPALYLLIALPLFGRAQVFERQPGGIAEEVDGVVVADGVAGALAVPAELPRADDGAAGASGGKRIGLVSAAIRVLQDAGNEPMSCPDMVKQATERGYWQPLAGKTPVSTLYATILREIRDKGESSRFKKVDRGRFMLNR